MNADKRKLKCIIQQKGVINKGKIEFKDEEGNSYPDVGKFRKGGTNSLAENKMEEKKQQYFPQRGKREKETKKEGRRMMGKRNNALQGVTNKLDAWAAWRGLTFFTSKIVNMVFRKSKK